MHTFQLIQYIQRIEWKQFNYIQHIVGSITLSTGICNYTYYELRNTLTNLKLNLTSILEDIPKKARVARHLGG